MKKKTELNIFFSPADMATNSLWDIVSESRDILKAHRRHFLILTLFFLFPVSFSVLVYPTLSHLFIHLPNNISHTLLQHHPTSLFFPLLYTFFPSIFSICGIITITYSVFHFFHGQPVNLQSAIKSISTSFLPLLATTILSQVIIFSISIFYGLLLLLLIHGADLLHLTIPYSSFLSPYVIAFFIALPLLLLLTYLQVNWTLVPVIVVVESCWGLEPLRRSTRLIRGMKGIALSSFLLYGISAGLFVWNCLFVTTGYNGITQNWSSVLQKWVIIVTFSYLLTTVMLSSLAVNTVLYIHCKANHGELAEEFGKDYVSLPFHVGNFSRAV